MKKRMIRFAASLLALCMIFGTVPASAAAQEVFVPGVWKVTKISTMGLTLDPEPWGMTMQVEFFENGTAHMHSVTDGSTDDTDLEWEIRDGKIMLGLGGDIMELTPEGDTLVGKIAIEGMEDFQMIFTRVGEKPAAAAPTAATGPATGLSMNAAACTMLRTAPALRLSGAPGHAMCTKMRRNASGSSPSVSSASKIRAATKR